MMELTEQHKHIYNLYLRAFRVNNNNPFRPKKDFKDVIKDPEKMMALQKIDQVFQKYPAFCSNLYFDAPYKIYKDEKPFYSLKFFGSQKGISTCLAYVKLLRNSNPEEQFEFIKESYKFIAEFCIEKRIPLEHYTRHCSVAQNDCLKHLKEHKISWFLIFSVPHFHSLIFNLPQDEFQIYYGSDVSLSSLYSRYQSSPLTQKYMTAIKNKISEHIMKIICSDDAPMR